MELQTVLLLVAAFMVYSSSASYHVLTADGQSELSEEQDSFWSHSRKRRSLIDPDDIFNSLIEEDDYSGIGSGFEDEVFSRELTLQFFVKNADAENSARTTLAEFMPGNAILLDFNIHNQGRSYGFDKAKSMGEKDATQEYEDSIRSGHSAIMIGDVRTADSKCADCASDRSEDIESVSAVINIAPGDVFSVSLTYIVPISQDSIEYQKDLYRTDVTIEVDYPATGFSGVIMSPNYPESYPNNADITWLIKVPPGKMVVRANLISFESESCCDHLYMYDGATDSAPLLAVISGDSHSTDAVVSTGSNMLLKFQSDCLVNDGGFSLEFSAMTGFYAGDEDKASFNQTFDIYQNQGVVYSPGYPMSYPPSSALSWSITSDPGTFMTVTIIDVDIITGETLSIYDGTSGDLIGSTTSGFLAPSFSLKTSGNKVSLSFVTKEKILPFRGFYVGFQSRALNNPCSGNIVLDLDEYDWNTLTSPNYPDNYDNNADCTWKISAPDGGKVRIEVDTMNLESVYDTLKIYDSNGTDVESTLMTTLSGLGGKKVEYITTGNVATIIFASDTSVTASGFRIKYRKYLDTTQCSSSTMIIKSPGGFVANPGYPYYAYGIVNCNWLISVSSDKIIKFIIDRFHAHGATLTFYDGDSNSDAVLWYTNSDVYDTRFSSSSDQVFVGLVNPYVDHIEYSFLFSEIENDEQACGSPLVLTEFPGVILSPNFPSLYPNDLYCQWLIQGSVDEGSVSLFIEQLRLGYSNDTLTFYDGSSTASSIIQQCGNYYYYCGKGSTFRSSGRNMLIALSTVTSDGYFKLKYNVGSDPLMYNIGVYSGYVISPNYPSYYPNYYSHLYSITVPSGYIVFTFEYFYTQYNDDFLKLYDGMSTSSALIITLSGYQSGYSGQTTGAYLTMYFSTDGSYNDPGFNMNYRASNASAGTAYSYRFVEKSYNELQFFSPGYSGSYPDNVDFYWYIQCDEAYQIYYRMYMLDIDSTDFMKFYRDFGTDSSTLYTTLTGIVDHSGYGVSVYNERSTVWFHSDYEFTGLGFLGGYECHN